MRIKNIVIALKLNSSTIIINWRQFADTFQTDWGKNSKKKQQHTYLEKIKKYPQQKKKKKEMC